MEPHKEQKMENKYEVGMVFENSRGNAFKVIEYIAKTGEVVLQSEFFESFSSMGNVRVLPSYKISELML